MATTDDLRREAAEVEDDSFVSPLQLRLAASIVGRIVDRNGGCGSADAFWDDEPTDDESEEYVDPELWDPDAETLPEMAFIEENIFECL